MSGERSTHQDHSSARSSLSCGSALQKAQILITKPLFNQPGCSRALHAPPQETGAHCTARPPAAELGRMPASCVTVGISFHPASHSRKNPSADNTSEPKPTIKAKRYREQNPLPHLATACSLF